MELTIEEIKELKMERIQELKNEITKYERILPTADRLIAKSMMQCIENAQKIINELEIEINNL